MTPEPIKSFQLKKKTVDKKEVPAGPIVNTTPIIYGPPDMILKKKEENK